MANRMYKSGPDRVQLSLLPPCPEDYVDADNPARAIEAYVGSLDLGALGFCHAGARSGARSGAGQPAYDPGDLLKLYLYGYLNQVRSSRRLAREAQRNLELIWLLKGLAPGYRTIADFRKANAGALKAANRDFVLLMRDLDLLGAELVAVDGAFFRGDAAKASIATRKTLAKQIAALDADITAYEQALEANDAAEAAREAGTEAGGASPADRLKDKLARRARRQAELAALEQGGEGQVSRTDPDARLLAKSGQSVAGYNVQCAVDARHKLICASEVVNDGNDTGQLHAMAEAARAALGADKLTVVADAGYYDGEEIRACEAAGIVPYVPEPDRAGRAAADGRFGLTDFLYEPEADAYRCPGDKLLKPMGRLATNASGKRYRRYASAKAGCAACPLRAQCLTAKARRREVLRWEHEEAIERHRARMAGAEAKAMMKQRAALAEHPFGTLKCRAGWRHFLVRGFTRVRGEWSLMVLAYNLGRVLSILGMDRLKAHLAKRRATLLRACLVLMAAIGARGGPAARRSLDPRKNPARTRPRRPVAA